MPLPRSRVHSRPRPLRVLVTGGPTRAYLDQFRFLSNHSTGALALELCRELLRKGVDVAAVVGPTHLDFQVLGLAAYRSVETVSEMHAEVLSLCRRFRPDVAIFSAAVLDFSPSRIRRGKVSSRRSWVVRLTPTPKIIDSVGSRFPGVRRIGFKLDPNAGGVKRSILRAKQVLREKRLEAVCLNHLSNIDDKSHPAFIVTRSGIVRRARSKRAIAKALSTIAISLTRPVKPESRRKVSRSR